MELDEDIAWLLGVIQGDGHVDRYFVEVSDAHKENLDVVASVISKLGYRAVIKRDSRERRYRLWVNSVDFVRFIERSDLLDKGSVPDTIRGRLVIPYVQGLYDAEGYVEFWKPRRMLRINFAYKYYNIARYVAEVLANHGIRPYMRFSSKVYRVQVYRKEDVSKFFTVIGFRYPTKSIFKFILFSLEAPRATAQHTQRNWRGSTTRGGACGLIGVNAGNLTGGDSRMTARLKALPDALRGGAWPSPDTVMAPVTFKFISGSAFLWREKWSIN